MSMWYDRESCLVFADEGLINRKLQTSPPHSCQQDPWCLFPFLHSSTTARSCQSTTSYGAQFYWKEIFSTPTTFSKCHPFRPWPWGGGGMPRRRPLRWWGPRPFWCYLCFPWWSSPGDWSLLDEGRRQQRTKEDLGDCPVHTPHLVSLQACVVQKCERCPCRVAPKYNLESGCQGWSPVQFSGGYQRRGATIKVQLIRSSDVIRRRLNLHNPKPNTKGGCTIQDL